MAKGRTKALQAGGGQDRSYREATSRLASNYLLKGLKFIFVLAFEIKMIKVLNKEKKTFSIMEEWILGGKQVVESHTFNGPELTYGLHLCYNQGLSCIRGPVQCTVCIRG